MDFIQPKCWFCQFFYVFSSTTFLYQNLIVVSFRFPFLNFLGVTCLKMFVDFPPLITL